MPPSVPNPAGAGRPTLGRLSGLSPVEADRGERVLWLSGDGYRAALLHLGALTRLNQLGLLAPLGTIGADSGGSIAAAVLATRVSWPFQGAFADWEESVAGPLREIASATEAGAGTGHQRRPFPGMAGEAALEERYARELLDSMGGIPDRGPRFVFGASGLALSGIDADRAESLEWEIGEAAAGGYSPELVSGKIATLHTDLEGFGEAERAALENHGYLLAADAARARGLSGTSEGSATQPPHPEWMDEERVRAALVESGRRPRVRRLHLRRRGETPQPRRMPPRAG